MKYIKLHTICIIKRVNFIKIGNFTFHVEIGLKEELEYIFQLYVGNFRILSCKYEA